MTDKAPEPGEHHPGDPVEEHAPETDVVEAARAGLAEAEALSGADVRPSDAPSSHDDEAPAFETPELAAAFAATSAAVEEEVREETGASEAARGEGAEEGSSLTPPPPPALPGADETRADDLDAMRVVPAVSDAAPADSARDASVADVATVAYAAQPSETIVPQEPVLTPPAAPAPQVQPIFVQAPEPPRIRGNRGAIAGIGLLATLSLGLVALGVGALVTFLSGGSVSDIVDGVLGAFASAAFWGVLVAFYLAFCLVGAFVNRGRWGFWVNFSWLPGLAALVGGALATIVTAPFWTIPASAGWRVIVEDTVAPGAVLVFAVAVFLTIWFGAWASARGRRVSELNAEAQREYQETLDAGPQLLH